MDSNEQTRHDVDVVAAHETLPRWEIRGLEFGIFMAFLFSSVLGFASLGYAVGVWILGPPNPEDPGTLLALFEGLGVQTGLLAAYAGVVALTGAPPRSTAARPTAGRAATIGLKWLLFSYPAMILASLIWQWCLGNLGFEHVIQEPVKMVQQGGDSLERAFMYLMILVVAPICEELVFRGAIFRYLHHRCPFLWAAGLSGLLFATIHFNLYSFAPLVVMGIGLAVAYRQSGSLISCMAFHSAFNGISLVLILVAETLA